jgi:hypothetical protein
MIIDYIHSAQDLLEEEPSRELALVKTKLEEAELWLQRAAEAPTRQQRRAAEREARKAGAE